jgi:hypothetical protein
MRYNWLKKTPKIWVSSRFDDLKYDFPEICQGKGLGGPPMRGPKTDNFKGVFWCTDCNSWTFIYSGKMIQGDIFRIRWTAGIDGFFLKFHPRKNLTAKAEDLPGPVETVPNIFRKVRQGYRRSLKKSGNVIDDYYKKSVRVGEDFEKYPDTFGNQSSKDGVFESHEII